MKRILLILLFTVSCSLLTAFGQQGEWTWMNGGDSINAQGHYGTKGIFAIGNTPPGLYGACQWTDMDGNFWLFGGQNLGNCSDLWVFKPYLNQWAWIDGPGIFDQSGIYGTQNIPSINNNPGARIYSATWVDTIGNLWLFGGDGLDINGNIGLLNDLWRY